MKEVSAPIQRVVVSARELPHIKEREIIISVENAHNISVCSFFESHIDEVIKKLTELKTTTK